MTVNLNNLKAKFFSDPDWKEVEELLMDFVTPLIEMRDIDTSQPSENVKAEVIARQKSYELITAFLEQTTIVGNPNQYKKTGTFK
jgi:hypothetical protein